MIMTAHTGDILGQWKCDWKCLYTELVGEPEKIERVVKFSYKVLLLSTYFSETFLRAND